MAKGSLGVVVVVERTSGESPLALMLGGCHSLCGAILYSSGQMW